MTCDEVRESISALLDQEASPLDGTVVEQHLRGCPECRTWEREARQLQRRVRVTAAPPPLDRTVQFMAAVQADHARRLSRRRRLLPMRLGLVVVAATQLAMSEPLLLLGHDRAAPEHVAHELGAFNVAIAVGLLLAAYLPRLAVGMVPIVGVVAALLLLTAGADVAVGNTRPGEELPHLLEVGGFLLLLRLAYLNGGGDWTPLLLPMRKPTPAIATGATSGDSIH